MFSVAWFIKLRYCSFTLSLAMFFYHAINYTNYFGILNQPMVYLGQSHLDLLYNSLCTLVKPTNILSRQLQRILNYCFLFMSFSVFQTYYMYICVCVLINVCKYMYVRRYACLILPSAGKDLLELE